MKERHKREIDAFRESGYCDHKNAEWIPYFGRGTRGEVLICKSCEKIIQENLEKHDAYDYTPWKFWGGVNLINHDMGESDDEERHSGPT